MTTFGPLAFWVIDNLDAAFPILDINLRINPKDSIRGDP